MSVLETLDFQPMLIMDMFELHPGSGMPKTDVGPIPYVAASFQRNGIVGYVDNAKYPGGWLSLVKDGDGGAGTCFYQPVPFWPSNHVYALEPRDAQPSAAALIVMASIITHQCFPKFNRGNAATVARLSRQYVMVPAITTVDGAVEPDWKGMDRLGTELLDQVVTHTHSARATSSTDDDALPALRFEPMFITDVFESMAASKAWYNRVHLVDGAGSNLYLSQTQNGNSVSAIVADQGSTPEPGNCITVTLKTQSTFYQPAPFYTAQNFLIFRHKNLNPDSGLFLVTIMRNAMKKFSWGYGVSMARLEKTKIMVPVTSDASGKDVVDWDGMSAYGHALRVRAERSLEPVLG
ncbi:restriction endonuclease subunit S [Dermabacteraceae bacterium P13088]